MLGMKPNCREKINNKSLRSPFARLPHTRGDPPERNFDARVADAGPCMTLPGFDGAVRPAGIYSPIQLAPRPRHNLRAECFRRTELVRRIMCSTGTIVAAIHSGAG